MGYSYLGGRKLAKIAHLEITPQLQKQMKALTKLTTPITTPTTTPITTPITTITINLFPQMMIYGFIYHGNKELEEQPNITELLLEKENLMASQQMLS